MPFALWSAVEDRAREGELHRAIELAAAPFSPKHISKMSGGSEVGDPHCLIGPRLREEYSPALCVSECAGQRVYARCQPAPAGPVYLLPRLLRWPCEGSIYSAHEGELPQL